MGVQYPTLLLVLKIRRNWCLYVGRKRQTKLVPYDVDSDPRNDNKKNEAQDHHIITITHSVNPSQPKSSNHGHWEVTKCIELNDNIRFYSNNKEWRCIPYNG